MDRIKLLLIVNIILNLGSLMGIIVWAIQDDIYTLTSIYGFYWFVSIFSLISGLLGVFFHTISNNTTLQIPINQYGIYVMTFYSIIMSVFWFASSIAVTQLTRDCLYIKYKYSSLVDYYYAKKEFTCNGEIISMTFGFGLLLLWVVILSIISKNLYERMIVEHSKKNEEVEMTRTDNIEVGIEGRPAFEETRN
jgi:hypothetical protein